MGSRLELLKRKQIGKSKINAFKNLFLELGFTSLQLIELDESDIILGKLKILFSNLPSENEMISEDKPFIESDLIRHIYLNLDETSKSYVFTDDFSFCGLFLVNAKQVLEQALNIARKDSGQTCFIADFDFSYYLRINFYDTEHSDSPSSYDIQRILRK